MRVIIAGSRGFVDARLMTEKLDKYFCFNKPSLIVTGGAMGADQLGENYAKRMNIPFQRYLPQWKIFGKSAGMKRNIIMAENADALVAFWDGASRGTAQMIEYANMKGLKVRVVLF
jgi:hypothetical protein